jgi:hypothetical protein
MPVIPALGRLRQKDGEFEASLGYIHTESLSQKANQPTNQQKIPGLFKISDHCLFVFFYWVLNFGLVDSYFQVTVLIP